MEWLLLVTCGMVRRNFGISVARPQISQPCAQSIGSAIWERMQQWT